MDEPDKHGESKKRRTPLDALKSLKRLFGGKRNKEEDAKVYKSKSTSNVLEAADDDEAGTSGAGSLTGKPKSLSADNVFPAGGAPGESARSSSVNPLPVTGINAELTRVLIRQQRGAGVSRGGGGGGRDEEDEGLPNSPTDTNSADIDSHLAGSGDKSSCYDSENSLLSVESLDAEMEDTEDFFKSSWSMQQTAPSPEECSLDLSSVPTTQRVNLDSQRHKLAIKQKGKRASTAFGPKKRATSPMMASSLAVLPQLEEETMEEPATPPTPSDEDLIAEAKKEVSAVTIEEVPPPENEVVEETQEEEIEVTVPDEMPSKAPSVSDLTTTKPLNIPSTQSNTLSESVVLRKASPSQLKPPPVTHRRSSDRESTHSGCSPRNSDLEKRKSSGSTTEHSVFGERKIVGNRSSIGETKDWDSVGKSSSPDGEEQGTEAGTEFSKMLTKFKRNASQKKADQVKEADSLDQLSQSPTMTVLAASAITEMPSQADSSKAVLNPSPVVVKPSPVVVKPSPAVVKPSPVVVKPSPAVVKPSPVVVKPSPAVVKPSPVVVKPSPPVLKPSAVVKPAGKTPVSPVDSKTKEVKVISSETGKSAAASSLGFSTTSGSHHGVSSTDKGLSPTSKNTVVQRRSPESDKHAVHPKATNSRPRSPDSKTVVNPVSAKPSLTVTAAKTSDSGTKTTGHKPLDFTTSSKTSVLKTPSSLNGSKIMEPKPQDSVTQEKSSGTTSFNVHLRKTRGNLPSDKTPSNKPFGDKIVTRSSVTSDKSDNDKDVMTTDKASSNSVSINKSQSLKAASPSGPFRRDNPLFKDRVRSRTVPDKTQDSSIHSELSQSRQARMDVENKVLTNLTKKSDAPKDRPRSVCIGTATGPKTPSPVNEAAKNKPASSSRPSSLSSQPADEESTAGQAPWAALALKKTSNFNKGKGSVDVESNQLTAKP